MSRRNIQSSDLPSSVATATVTAGAPTTGTWSTYQTIIDSNGVNWTCTAGGTPGTWKEGAPAAPANMALGDLLIGASSSTVSRLPIGGISSSPRVSSAGALAYTQDRINVKDYGAIGNGVVITDAAISSGATALSSAGQYTFTSADVGKHATIQGAGATPTGVLSSVIQNVSGGVATLGTTATTTVSSAECSFGTDDSTAIQNALTALANTGGTVFFPAAIYMVANTSALICPGGVLMLGTSMDYPNVSGSAGTPTPPARGSIIRCAATSSPTIMLQLGASGDASVASGHTGASIERMMIDGNNYAITACRMAARRCYARFSQIFRGRDYALSVSGGGQNVYIENCVIAQNDQGTPLLINGAADTHIFNSQIREGGPFKTGTNPLGSTYPTYGAQVEVYNGQDVQFVGNHIFSGFQGVLNSSYPSDNIRICGTTTNLITITGNVLDGTYGHHLNIVPDSSGSVLYVTITGNEIWQQAVAVNTYAAVKVDTSKSSTSKVAHLNVISNVLNGTNTCWTGITDISGIGTTNCVSLIGNSGYGMTNFYANQRPETVLGNHMHTISSAVLHTETSAETTFTGDGSTVQFKVAHTLGGNSGGTIPTRKRFSASSAAAAVTGVYMTADTTYVYFNFPSAPASAASIVMDWEAAL
jgi:hypothetical protein